MCPSPLPIGCTSRGNREILALSFIVFPFLLLFAYSFMEEVRISAASVHCSNKVGILSSSLSRMFPVSEGVTHRGGANPPIAPRSRVFCHGGEGGVGVCLDGGKPHHWTLSGKLVEA